MASEPPTSELIAEGALVVLRDGSRIRVRQGHRSDRELLLRGFERLSPGSRYRRFLMATPQLSDEMVRYLTEIDHHDHEAIAAFDELTGEGVGVARFVRKSDRPDVAEVAVTVVDEWQGRGVATVLLEVLSGRARAEGVTSFTGLLLASNREMMELLESLGPVRTLDRQAGTVEVEMPLHDAGLSPALRKLLRVVATVTGTRPPPATEPAAD
ncbi:MAG TPA: GNAT family N-acetyltransferase [Solirubrobacteraceae bacterium]|nr:GNAT family N-acetyltransferase [Solirubrobacteraceae bacterium]